MAASGSKRYCIPGFPVYYFSRASSGVAVIAGDSSAGASTQLESDEERPWIDLEKHLNQQHVCIANVF